MIRKQRLGMSLCLFASSMFTGRLNHSLCYLCYNLAVFLDTRKVSTFRSFADKCQATLHLASFQLYGSRTFPVFARIFRRILACDIWSTYCSMSQYFMRPSLPELTIRPASFFPFTIMNFSLIDSILKDKSDDV